MSNTLTGLIKPVTLGYFAVCDDTPTQTFNTMDNCLDWLDANCAESLAPVLEILKYPNTLPTVPCGYFFDGWQSGTDCF